MSPATGAGRYEESGSPPDEERSHAWSSFDLNAAIKRMEDNPDLPVVELTVETPMTTATRTKPAVPTSAPTSSTTGDRRHARPLERAAGFSSATRGWRA